MDTDALYMVAKPLKADGKTFDVGDIIPHESVKTIPWLHSYVSTNHILVIRGDNFPKWVPPHMYPYMESVQRAQEMIAGDPGITFEAALAAAEKKRRSVEYRLAEARAELQRAFSASQRPGAGKAEKDALADAERAVEEASKPWSDPAPEVPEPEVPEPDPEPEPEVPEPEPETPEPDPEPDPDPEEPGEGQGAARAAALAADEPKTTAKTASAKKTQSKSTTKK